MFVSDLKPNQAVDDITLEIVDVGETKEFTNFRGKIRVANAKVKDETGECSLTLWNDEIETYGGAKKIRITNGWCKEYRGEVQVSSGKYGKVEMLGEGETKPKEVDAEPKEKAVKKAPKKKAGKKPAKKEEEALEEGNESDDAVFSEAEKDPDIEYDEKYGKKDL